MLVGGDDVAADTAIDNALHLLHHYLRLAVADVVDAHKRLLQQFVHDDGAFILAEGVGINIFVAQLLGHINAHLLGYVVFVE